MFRFKLPTPIREEFPKTIEGKVKMFLAKNEWLEQRGYTPIGLERFFEIVFTRKGVLHFQEAGEEHYYDKHYNGIVMFLDNKKKPLCRILNREFRSELAHIKDHPFAISAPLTYIGRSRKGENARYAFGFAIDLDGVDITQINNLHTAIDRGLIIQPNIIVNSGNGLHIYYLFDKPVALFPQSVKALQKLKAALTYMVWRKNTSVFDDDDEIQIQGIFQGFRLPESQTKFGTRVSAYYHESTPLWSIRELNRHYSREFEPRHNPPSISEEEVIQIEKAQYIPSKVGIEKAKELYPDWYEKRIVRKEKGRGWTVKRDLYDWFLRAIICDNKIRVGHRYFAIMTLACYAVKCGISKEELERDAYSLLEPFENMKAGEDNHFTIDDIKDALRAYEECYRTFPRKTIERLIGVAFPAQKRNYRNRETHVKMMHLIRDNIAYPDGGWQGRPKADIWNSEHAFRVRQWRRANPESKNKSKCARETGVSRMTIYKWWNSLDEVSDRDDKLLAEQNKWRL